MNEWKQWTNGSLKIDWPTDYWPTSLVDRLTDWPLTDRLNDSADNENGGYWMIDNIIYFCFVRIVLCFFFSFTSTNLYDDTWQHVCLTWENTQGVAKLYKDDQFAGQVTNNATENFTLTAGGFLVLGQDQDSIGGGFIRKQTLRGRLASVNMWDKVLSESDIAAQYTNCSVPYGSVLTWSVFKNLTHGNVTVEEPGSKLFRDQTL